MTKLVRQVSLGETELIQIISKITSAAQNRYVSWDITVTCIVVNIFHRGARNYCSFSWAFYTASSLHRSKTQICNVLKSD